MAILFSAALALSLLFPVLGYFPLLLLWLTDPLQRVVHRVVRGRTHIPTSSDQSPTR